MKKLNLHIAPNFAVLGLAATAITLTSAGSGLAATFNLTFTQLAGLTGSSAGTGVYVTDLSVVGFDISSIWIADSNSGVGGSPGKFSAFDLDGIKLSNTLITNAADINSLPGLSVFDFSSAGTILTPGTQRPPADPALFGTTGGNIDNAVATLGSFDAHSIAGPEAFGFASLGDGGKVAFNLTSAVSTTSPIYLYIGEVGNNGELAAGLIGVSDTPVNIPEPVNVPEPASLAALSLAGIYFTTRRAGKRTKGA